MVSIQNPSVTVSDVWQYADRSLSNETDFFSRLGNTLLNFLIGDTYQNGQWGWFLSQGIVEGVKELLNNRTLKIHSFNMETFDTPLNISAEYIDGIKCSNEWAVGQNKYVIKPTLYKSDMEKTTVTPGILEFTLNNSRELGNTAIHPCGRFSDELTEGSQTSYNISSVLFNDTTHYICSWDLNSYSSKYFLVGNTMYIANSSTCFSQSARLDYATVNKIISPDAALMNNTVYTPLNITGQNIVNISITFLFPTSNVWTVDYKIGDVISGNITIPAGTTKFNTPLNFNWDISTANDNLSLVFTRPTDGFDNDGLKSISVTEVINTQTALTTMVSKL